MNKYLQSSVSSQGGELCIGGVGVFAGYLGRDDLTAKALVEIDGQLFYRTGDLVRMDSNGLLHYQGRKDHQIKLHGQRIELGEIERCLLNITSISACVVMKWNDDYLVAYVQSSAHINEEQLRQHCQSHLPPHMIPSIFVILDKLPLNQNGKVDRKQLPSPQFSTSTLLSSDTADTPLNQFEQRILTIWCQVLHSSENHISRTTSFFSIGGHSLLFIELYHHYQSVFNFDAHTLSIAPFLQQPTIVQHSQLLQTVIMNNIKATQWHTLHINEGIASFAQERIFLDEQVRFSSDIAIYNEVSTLQVVQGPLSLNRLLQAFRYVLNKHKILRTSLIFSNDDGILKQCITDIHKTFTITMNRTFENDNELRDIIYQTTVNPNLFDLLTGHVFHAEILKHQISLNENGNSGNEFITNSDVLLIGFHHAAFDRSSSSIFFNDLCLAYNTNAISIEDDDESLQYIDYSIHERLVDMTTSREFWYLQLEGYDLESRLSLPVDRQRVSNEHRSSSASATQISFDNEISQSFLDYASIHHVTPFQLGLSILYAFLFKLTHGENDLCISSINANRYRNELQNIIGMFVSTLPHRVQLDSQWSLDELVKYVREKCLSILEHSHYPLQHILADLHINQSNISFLEAIYDFITLSSHSGELSLNEASFKQVSFEQSFEVAKFDFMLTFIHNPMLQNNRLSFRLTCSRDLFDETTVTQISRRLEYCFQQLFSLNENMDRIHTCFTCISKFNLILPEETQELEDTIFCRQLHIINEGPASFAQIRLYHNESIHFTPYTSQIPIYDMPFVYHLHSHHTLSVQQLRHALHLIFRKHQSLHTSLLFDTEKNLVIQRIIDINDNSRQLFTFIESVYETQEKLNSILYDEKYNPQLFDLAQGLVFRCHLVYYKQIPPNHLLSHKDLLIFNFHHALFDFPSMNIFLHDLNQAYTTGQLLYDDNTNLRYLDYAVIEQQMSKTSASMFWLDVLHDCKLDQPLSLPFDRYRLSNEHQTGRGTSISFDFGQDLSHDFLTYASSNNISPEHLIFAIYFIFLFKLTNGQTDLCLAMNINNNRYRDELKSIIGLFENVIPLRCQLDPHWCFRQLIEHVREITTKSMKYSYFPLQRILDQHPNISKYAFLDTSLKFISYKDNNTIMIGDSQLVPVSSSFNINEDEILRVSEISLSIHHDMNINQLSCKINTSLDLFNRDTAEKISKQFHFVLHRLSASLIDNQTNKPVYELSLILPNEQYLMQSLNNTQMSFSSPVTCIHHEFVCQVMKHPQKLAVELDEQSLTYCELLYYVQVLSLTLLNEYHVFPGEVVCQCVERSLSMVIGIMGIEMAGGVYCPLSPRDPQHRLYILTQQTQSRLVLVHYLTKTKFNDDIISPDIDSMLNITNIDKKGLSSAIVKGDQIAYIIFTSGSTGTPKAVQVRHKNFIGCMHSLVGIDTFNKDNTAVQMARCSFDIHVQEILGESFSSRLAVLITKIDTLTCTVWNLYGPAETTIASTAYRVNMISERQNVPIGQPFGNYRCLIMDEFQQSCITNQDSELFIGGVGVFTGYLGRDDLSAKTFIYINDELFYRTGDLVHVDNKGLIHYVGRKDYQIKLHGQRIELGEIERCLFNIASISACVVIKWGNDHLIAYVQSSHINENELRGHCQSHLPPHMIPSLFVILDKLPLNANGKVDRKLLPPPHFSSTHLTNSIELSLPTNDTELSIHHIWCEILKLKQISTNTNIFTIGGHSLVIMQLFHRYKIEFHLETNSLSITDLFQHPTIIDHALLIYQTMNVTQNMNDYHWSSLHITKAKASFAQERIFLDEQIRFSSADNNTNNMYVIPLIYRISSVNDHISVSQLQHAFQSILRKYQILRTALSLDINGTIIQHCLDTNTIINDNKSSRLSMIDLPDEEHEQNAIIKKILNQSDLFDLSKGHVINCHILRQHQSNRSFTHNNNDLLTNDDFILFTIHHACFDGASTSIFIRDLSLAYQSNDLLPTDDNSLQYIDYSIHEHIMDIISSQEFWLLELKGCNPTHQLSLPVDRQRSSTNQQRSGLASSAQITFDDEICASFLNYASSHHLTLFQLGLSIFYVFLFKLSHGESDLCISSINANRYRSELVNMIGMFVSTLPYRVELDSQWSFDEIVRYVQEKCLSILEHSHYPLQHILADLHLTQSNVSFLETMFDFITISEDVSGLRLNGVILEQVLLEKPYEMAKFDFSLNFVYNSSSDDKQLCCSFVCSNDLYDERTILTLTQRFKYLCEQLFSSTSMEKPVDTCSTAISRLSLILSSEMKEMQDYVFCRQINVKNRAPASFAQARIWLDERIRFDPDRPQIAIYNMPFVYHLHSHHTLSINQLRHALHLTVNKHPSLHTSLHFDIEKNTLMQRVITHEDKNNNLFSIIETTYETDEQLNEILHDEKRNPHLFDLAQGLVFRFHLVYHKQISSNHLLSHKDLLIFNFHHALFDFPSMKVFHHDLNQAYTTGQLLYDDNTNLRYLDYAVIEQQMSMTGASMFWLDALHECKLDQSMSLPYDRYRLSNEHRTGRGTSISFDFGQDLSHDFLSHALSNNISLDQLALATYYVFLFKLTNGEKDLCIGINTHGRYRDELNSIIGMFVNAIPLRCQLDPHLSFDKITKHIHDDMINCMKYSYFPLQRILNQHPNISNPVFLDTSFEFLSSMRRDEENEIMIGDSRFSLLPYSIKISEDEVMSKFDFIVSFQHDLNLNEFSCTINASLDLFNAETISIIAQRFQTMLYQQFISFDCTANRPIYELSLMLSNEQYLMQSLNNTQMSFPSPVTCIHHEFAYQVMKHPQKLAVELDEQSLTYCEMLYYVQILSLTLLNEHHVVPGEIVCQCVERSLSMVIGIMATEMAGGVYCPLSPRDPPHRLHALTQQTRSRLVLVHDSTKTKFSYDSVLLSIDSILTNTETDSKIQANRLSNIAVIPGNVAYIIFTSGSTGIPKPAQLRHRNFTQSVQSLVHIDIFNKNDTIIQMARCSFDLHVQEILGAFIIGATVIMLHPRGNVDFEYLSKIMENKQITFLYTVPTLLALFFNFIKETKKTYIMQYLRSLCTGGERCSVQLVELLESIVNNDCSIWNLCGPAETTLQSLFHRVNSQVDTETIPLGRPLPNYSCTVEDNFGLPLFIGQEGEILVRGVGIFAGYLGCDDLTAKALVEIDDQLFYRTGDLVRMDNNGLLHYQGRKDHQIKLHGQRIELGEIERCLLNVTSICACVVIKWSDDHLVAYAQSSDIDENRLRDHCKSHLPPHMIPSFFIILDKLPLNANGKIDRKLLPPPDFLSSGPGYDSNAPSSTLEQQLQKIFSQVFHIESPPIDVPFGKLGGTSLDAIRALTLIRQQICTNVDILLLFSNPSIRQLAQAIEPLLILNKPQDTIITSKQDDETYIRSLPSPLIETIGIILLVCQWVLPITIIINQCQPFLFLILPISHLVLYIICSRLFSLKNNKSDDIFSWNYYRWWFLDRLWNNNRFWLQHIIGTPLYNNYLRLCGADVSLDAHIYSTIMDAPWLLDIDDGTWIADQTVFNCLHFNNDNNTFQLYPIRIASNCSIGTRTILYDGVNIEKNVIIQPMSSVNGFVAARTIIDGDDDKSSSTNTFMTYNNRSLSIWHKIFQVIALSLLICIHSILLIIIYKVYSIVQVPLPICIAFCWTLWSILGCFISVVLLKFIVGSCAAGETYPIASWSYLHKLWLRQLVVSSFHHAWLLPNSYDHIYPIALRWLGAHIEDNVKISEIHTFLSYPTNLLHFERGVTTFGSVLLVPTELTLSGDHCVDYITLGSYTNLGNGCSILPGSHLASETMIGNLTRVSRETKSNDGDVFIGVPARVMPFKMPLRSTTTTTTTDEMKIIPIWHTCFTHVISKSLLLTIYSLTGVIGMLIIHTILICITYRYRSYIRYPIAQQIISRLRQDHQQFICPFLGNTQGLINLFRALGAHIGEGVIIPDFSCLTDYHLITIENNVRLNMHANIQCHSFEQRVLQLDFVTIKSSCILMSGSFVMAGCKLMGNNRLYPFTLVMKNDILLPNTQWKGLPARRALIIIRFDNENWQESKELIVYRLIAHSYFEELEYELNQHESIHKNDLAQSALQFAINEMKKVAEEAETVYNK
ncbi:unnamed protein product [Adineta steineri]|nr:unnamed protein product [Adineta steineri]